MEDHVADQKWEDSFGKVFTTNRNTTDDERYGKYKGVREYFSRKELAKIARREAGEDSDSSGPDADECVPQKTPWQKKPWIGCPGYITQEACARNDYKIEELECENIALKNRLDKLEKTVSVLELIRKQSEKDRLEKILKSTKKEEGDTPMTLEHILEVLNTIVMNQHRSQRGDPLLP